MIYAITVLGISWILAFAIWPGFNNIVHLVPEGRPGLALCGTKANVYDRAVEDIAKSSWAKCKRCEHQENKNETG